MESHPGPWTAYYERRGEDWVAWHPDHPDTGVVGHSLEEARKNLREVVHLLEQRFAQRLEGRPDLATACDACPDAGLDSSPADA